MTVAQRFAALRCWQRLGVVFVLSLPLAYALRLGVDWYLGPDLASAAQSYVRQRKDQPLSETLAQLLNDAAFTPQPTQAHALLGQQAASFDLPDDRGQKVNLDALRERGPVVVIFYYGYSCSHCVAQLFAANEDIKLFRELGAQVVAISADPPELTAERFREFGRFDFSVVADPENRVAERFKVYEPPTPERAAKLEHATFLIDRAGRVFWANSGIEPFLDNKTLLTQIARHEKRVPSPGPDGAPQVASAR